MSIYLGESFKHFYLNVHLSDEPFKHFLAKHMSIYPDEPIKHFLCMIEKLKKIHFETADIRNNNRIV